MRGEEYRVRRARKSPSAVLSVARQALINSILAESDLPRPSSVLLGKERFYHGPTSATSFDLPCAPDRL